MVFKGLSIQIARFRSRSRTGGGLIHETKIPVQKLWLKMGGGRIRGTLQYIDINFFKNLGGCGSLPS